MDEPTASVDVENQITIERIIREINREKRISVIFTTHNMIQASRLADEIVFLYEGRIAQSIYENIFSGRVEVDANGITHCHLNDKLRLRVHTKKRGRIRLSIDPNMLKMVEEKSGEENVIKGNITHLSLENGRVRALVDVGVPLSVLIPMNVFDGLHLKLGKPALIACPPGSLVFF